MNKTFRGAAVVMAIAAAVALIWQWRTIGQLRAEVAEAHKQAAGLAARNSAARKGIAGADRRGEASELRAESGRGRVEIATSAQKDAARFPAAAFKAENTREVVSPDDAKKSREIAQLHARYDPFFRERGMSDAEGERFIGLLRERVEIRQELQAAVRDAGATGGTRGVEALRAELYQPVTDQMRALLGEDGYEAYNEYERTSFYRSAFVERMAPVFAAANAALTAAQNEQLVRIVAANDHPVRKSATDIGTQSRIDWAAVAQQAGGFLTAQQQQALAAFAEQDARR